MISCLLLSALKPVLPTVFPDQSSNCILPADYAQSLGDILDPSPPITPQIQSISKFFQLYLKKHHHYLSDHLFLCDCDILLASLPDPTPFPLQSSLISAARGIPLNLKSCHSSVPSSLTVTIPLRVKFKVCPWSTKYYMVWPSPCTTFLLNYSAQIIMTSPSQSLCIYQMSAWVSPSLPLVLCSKLTLQSPLNLFKTATPSLITPHSSLLCFVCSPYPLTRDIFTISSIRLREMDNNSKTGITCLRFLNLKGCNSNYASGRLNLKMVPKMH